MSEAINTHHKLMTLQQIVDFCVIMGSKHLSCRGTQEKIWPGGSVQNFQAMSFQQVCTEKDL